MKLCVPFSVFTFEVEMFVVDVNYDLCCEIGILGLMGFS